MRIKKLKKEEKKEIMEKNRNKGEGYMVVVKGRLSGMKTMTKSWSEGKQGKSIGKKGRYSKETIKTGLGKIGIKVQWN